jgi:hypothetical protein
MEYRYVGGKYMYFMTAINRAYVVLSGCSLARCILIRIFATLSDMSDDLPPHPNVVIEPSFMIYLAYEMDDDYDNYLYHKLNDITCMISIGCKPMMISNLIWLKLA